MRGRLTATQRRGFYPEDERVRRRLERMRRRDPEKAARFEAFAEAWPLQNPLLATTRPAGRPVGGLAGAIAARGPHDTKTENDGAASEIVEAATSPSEAAASTSQKHGSTLTVLCSVACNLLVGVVDFAAATVSGSSAMLAEGIHSVVDSGNGLLVLLGIKRSSKRPDAAHPFGYGKELYFWTMIVSLIVFLFGGGLSLFEGVRTITDVKAGTAAELGDVTLNYIVLGASLLIEGASLAVALQAFNKARGDVRPLAFIRQAKDPSIYTVVLEDAASEIGLVGALAATVACQFTGNRLFDAGASLLIGVLLCAVAFTLLVETKRLLIGAGMEDDEVAELRALIEASPVVRACERVRTLYMGPRELVVAAAVTYCGGLSEREVRAENERLATQAAERWPEMGPLLLEAACGDVVAG